MKYLLLLSLFIFSSCLKTTQQLKSEQAYQEMNQSVQDSSQLLKNQTSRIQLLEERLALVEGQIGDLNSWMEESKNKKAENLDQELITERFKAIEEQQKQQQKIVLELTSEQKEIKSFLEKVTQLLSGLQGQSNSKPKGKKK